MRMLGGGGGGWGKGKGVILLERLGEENGLFAFSFCVNHLSALGQSMQPQCSK